ncbi:hypothetical protein BH09BAC6_BH09BAC6_20550 [soil metagenome]|jgi:hypothetical protein
MEVHHHPEVEKKNFKQYLLEGLMIFLAVTMGFFAEGLRERISAKEREKQYIESLENNLNKDKSDLAYFIRENKKKVSGLDSLLSLYDKDLSNPANRKLMYIYSQYISMVSIFSSNDATMTQLKNSGGLQFIKHGHVADSIAKYDQEMRGIFAADVPYTKFTSDATEAMTEMFVFNLNKDTVSKQGAGKEIFPLLSYNPHQIQVFFNKIKLERGWTQNYVKNLEERVPYNNKLIALLKNEYDLE